MDWIETNVRLPSGARPIEEYSRRYAQIAPDLVRAVYVAEPNGGRLWVDAKGLPVVDDGGCDAVTIEYAPSKKSLSARCNGDV